MEQQMEPIFLRYGGAEKLTTEMTKDELDQLSASILRRAKEKAFSKGRPIIFGEEGKVYAEWPDGIIEELKV
ncbi:MULTISPECIES: hypothetical protein [Niastella]|uniref:Uncharacterized protein n=1 Tax=Niastella soli TaxID=2821487 RepID=A0ABS3YYV5_9BACT|nr:hypothetical protein [Niastella soli]MBO9203104.1 hypothetical protein [Niastella soli]